MEEESTKKIKDGYQHNINAYFKLGLSKEIKLGNAELKLSDSTQIANYIDEVITSTMSYKQEDITQYNILIQNLCGKHQLLEEYSAEERLNKVEEIDSLFNVFIHILLNPKPIEKEEEKPTPPDTTTPVKKLKSKKNSQPTPTIKVDQSSEGDKSPNVISKRDVIINYGEWNQPKPDTTKNN